jgi:chemotaxis protein MotB
MGIKREVEEPFSAPGWIVTFSDMIGLLTSFFIMLMTYSTKEQKDYRKLQGALLAEFGLIANADDPDFDDLIAPDEAMANKLRNDGLRAKRNDLEQLNESAQIVVRAGAGESEVEFERLSDASRLRIHAPVAFAVGQSRLTPDQERLLSEVADLLRLHRCRILVVGHCWSEGASVQGEAALLELSRDRAIAVAEFLTTKGRLSDRYVGVCGRGESEPIDKARDARAAERNRRIELLVLQDA